jgi:hypothetical protein
MAEMWYYTCEGKQMDPITLKEMKRLVGDGSLKPTDMIWKEGMLRWIRASSLKELFPDPTTVLDQYFSGPKETPKASGMPPPVQSGTVAPGPGKKEPAPAEEPQARKRPRPSKEDAEEDSSRPPRRRAEANSGGGGFGIIIAFVVLGVVLLGALGGGVLILVVALKPSEPKPAEKVADNFKPNPIDKDNGKKQPEVKDDVLPPGVLEGQGTVESKSIFQNRDFILKFRVKAGHKASISATPVGAKFEPNLNMYVYKDNDPTNTPIATDDGPEPGARVTFSLPTQEIVRVRIHNASKKGSTKIAVIYNVSP